MEWQADIVVVEQDVKRSANSQVRARAAMQYTWWELYMMGESDVAESIDNCLGAQGFSRESHHATTSEDRDAYHAYRGRHSNLRCSLGVVSGNLGRSLGLVRSTSEPTQRAKATSQAIMDVVWSVRD